MIGVGTGTTYLPKFSKYMYLVWFSDADIKETHYEESKLLLRYKLGLQRKIRQDIFTWNDIAQFAHY